MKGLYCLIVLGSGIKFVVHGETFSRGYSKRVGEALINKAYYTKHKDTTLLAPLELIEWQE